MSRYKTRGSVSDRRWPGLTSLLLALGSLATAVDAAAAPLPSATPRAPGQVYAQVCGYCHDHPNAPVILGQEFDPAAVAYMVRNGPNGMPAFRPTEVSDAELEALAKWVAESDAKPQGGEQ